MTPITPEQAAAEARLRPNPASTDATDPALLEETISLVRRWLTESADIPPEGTAALLAEVLKDPNGLAFTTGFVDGVIRPEDTAVAAAALARLAPSVPRFVPFWLRAAVRLGGLFGPYLPGLVVPITRRVLRYMVSHLVIDARPAKLGAAIARLSDSQTRLNLNLLGEAVLGRREAKSRLDGTARMLARPDVDYVSLKVSSAVAPHAPWAFDHAVEETTERLMPLFREAQAQGGKFINLDMEEFHDLDLTIAVFTRILDRLPKLEAGIVIQAYLPDALAAYQGLVEWATARVDAGGGQIKVRLVKGANLPMEQIAASLHGWSLATWGTKMESDTNYLRVLDWALTPERTRAVRLGVAGHNLFDLAHTWLLAGRRGVRGALEFEMLLGMAKGQVEAVKREVGGIRLYTPVVAPDEFDVAIAYLVRRLEEGAASANFMSAVFELATNQELFDRERDRFLGSVAALDAVVPASNRTNDRFAASPRPELGRFENTPDTDPAVAANRAWAAEIQKRAPTSQLGNDTVEAAYLASPEAVESLVQVVLKAAPAWAERAAVERAQVLHRAGEELEARRADFLEVMAAEAGKTIDQGDPEVSEGVDFAHYYADAALELEAVPGAKFTPRHLTVVAPPWNFPMSIPAGGVLAALAAGSAVVL
jgi:RHH-type proline utilization regulon transcriptional repressor/proline dehydrogenase/delta 1-pyrroline-5-carboxylate dehydrogenase